MLSIIVGKPGSGKSYYCTENIAGQVCEWCRYELKHGTPFDRRLVTNIPINTEALREYVSEQLGSEFEDVSHYVNLWTDADFGEPESNPEWTSKDDKFLYWWDKFPKNSLVVIDEVHHYLGEEVEHRYSEDGQDYVTKFRNWLSTHRHKGQDVILLTQHLENIATPVIRMAEKLFEVTNAKSMNLPFPFSIPLSDLDVVRGAWGYDTQLFRVSIGTFRGRAVKFDGSVTTHVMSQKIFGLYKSHTLSDVSSDRPDLELGKFGSLLWFARKHAGHLVAKALIGGFVAYSGLKLIFALPMILSNSLVGGFGEGLAPGMTPAKTGKSAVAGQAGESVETLAEGTSSFNKETEYYKRLSQTLKTKNEELSEAVKKFQEVEDTKIIGIFPGGVLTTKGKIYVGEPIRWGGEPDYLKNVHIREGRVLLETGRLITL